jgi:hypothetical protein
MKSTVITLTFLFIAFLSYGQAPPISFAWEKNFGGTGRQTPKNFIIAQDGSYVIVGESSLNDAYVTKINNAGTSTLWTHNPSFSDPTNDITEVNNGYVTVGNESGGVVRIRKYQKNSNSIVSGYDNTYAVSNGNTIVSDNNNGVVFGGYTASSTLNKAYARQLLNNAPPSNGSYINDNPNGFWNGYAGVEKILNTPDGGYLLIGNNNIYTNDQPGCGGTFKNTNSNPENLLTGGSDIWICKINNSFQISWSMNYGGQTGDVFSDAVITSNGDIYILGNTYLCGIGTPTTIGPNNIGFGTWLMKLNSVGTLQNAKIISINMPDFTRDYTGLGLSCQSKVIACGKSGGLLGSSIIATKFDNSLNEEWIYSSTPSTSSTLEVKDIKQASDNSYAILCYNSQLNGGDIVLHKTSPDNCQTVATTFCNKAIPVTCGSFLSNQTTVGETNTISSYSCATGSTFAAGEKVYKLTLSQSGRIQIGLRANNIDLDLFLMNSNCSTPQCLVYSKSSGSNEFIDYQASAGEYYIVVDGNAGKEGSYIIDFACQNIDCTTSVLLQCNQTYSSTTVNGINNTSIYKLYNQPSGNYNFANYAKERVHKFTLNNTQQVTINLNSIYNLDLFLLDACDKDKCIQWSINPDGNESIITQLNPGTYYVVVDNDSGAEGSYSLNVNWNCCTTPSYINCSSSGPILHYYSGNGSNTRFTFVSSDQIASGYGWKVRQNGTDIIANGGTTADYTYTFPSDGAYEVCFPRYVNGCVEYCCFYVWIENPFNCGSIDYTYNASSNSYKFSTSTSGGTWLADNGSSAPSIISNASIPVGTCATRTISYRYWDGSRWRYCCRSVYICNPFTCGNADNILYGYNGSTQKFDFTLQNANQYSNISWQVDEPNPIILGSAPTVSWYPSNGLCKSYGITVKYYDPINNRWSICCRTVYVCDPFSCNIVTLGYRKSTNDLLFGLNGSTSTWTSYKWTQDETNTSIGTTATTTTKCPPINTNCQKYTYTVRYWDGLTWRICCIPVYLCNPNNCSSGINYTYTNGTLNLTTSSNYSQVKWYIEDSVVSASSSQSAGTYTVCCLYYDNINKYYRVCCREVTLSNGGSVPACTTILSPNNGATNISVSPIINWSSVNGATGYRLTVGTTSGGTQILNNVNVGNVTTYNLSNLQNNITYFVKVVPYNSFGNAINCSQTSFTTVGNNNNTLTFDIDDNICGSIGQIVEIPVRVKKFNNVASFQMSFKIQNTSVATFEGFSNASLTVVGSTPNVSTVIISWFDPAGVGATLSDNSIAFYLKLKLVGTNNTNTTIEFSDNPSKIEAGIIVANTISTITPITANGTVCINANQFQICGKINREDNIGITNVTVQITNSSGLNQTTATDAQGNYCFDNIPSGNVEIKPTKTDNPKNGVTSSDLFRIQQHNLQIQQLDSKYKMLAADANNSKSISSSDLFRIQQLILDLVPKFSDVDSWEFVPNEFALGTNPFSPIPPKSLVLNINQNFNNANFIGYKMGDVNLSNTPSFNTPSGERNVANLLLSASSHSAKIGEIVEVKIKADQFTQMIAFQFSLNWDSNILSFQSMGSSNQMLGLTTGNFNSTNANSGSIGVSWFDQTGKAITLADKTELFTLKFKVIGALDKSSNIIFGGTPVIISAENLSSIVNVLTTNGLVKVGNVSKSQDLSIGHFINLYPNPTSSVLYLDFLEKSSETVQIEILDCNSRILKRLNTDNNATIPIDVSDLPSQLYYLKVRMKDKVFYEKVIIQK